MRVKITLELVVISGLMALPVLRWITDRLILPGRRLNDELIRQDRPNIGAGVIEGTVYGCMSYLIGQCNQ